MTQFVLGFIGILFLGFPLGCLVYVMIFLAKETVKQIHELTNLFPALPLRVSIPKMQSLVVDVDEAEPYQDESGNNGGGVAWTAEEKKSELVPILTPEQDHGTDMPENNIPNIPEDSIRFEDDVLTDEEIDALRNSI